ncbi:zinc finger MIZ domain-containing protein 1-like isoform X2 [Uloborus diversus]|uniref:zinc finger MIZ domain-containing protein 1-like isoform X2 n=1 Tax=Uloborus diversus TaxID=327109 RepID=UPI002409E9C8|nr:zinc finger MIZ domain-containing protein 1-like isoform X2 [Uloborus diversus]
MSSFQEKWDPQGPEGGPQHGEVSWQTECKVGFGAERDGFTFSVYNNAGEKETLYSDTMGPGGWQSSAGGPPGAPPAPQGPPQQQLSVVTTVWGVATTTQSGPPFGANSNTYGGGATGGPYPPGKQVYPPAQNHPRQQGSNYNYSPNPAVGAGLGPNPQAGPEFQSSSSALSAAALVAAAATATATATASVVALQERQQQEVVINNQYNQGMPGGPPFQPSYDSSHQRMGPHPGMGMPVGGGKVQHPYPGSPQPGRNRNGPYPGPHVGQKRPYTMMHHPPQQQYGPGMQSYSPGPQQAYGAGQGCVCCSQYPRGGNPGQYGCQVPRYGGYPPQTGYSPPQQQVRPGMRQPGQPYGPSPPYCYHPQQPINGAPPTPTQSQYDHYGSPGQFPPTQPSAMQRNMNYQPLPIPGNPTPPLTPVVPPYLPTNADVKPNFTENKTPLPIPKEDELRLTFPVRDGIILAPFRLEHNLAVSNHVFHLKPSVQQTLAWRSDLELQLKCFHHEDRQMATNWPQSVQVSVNACPLTIDRGGEGGKTHRPLHLKEVCQPGRNTIQITVTACCCSHLFLLQLVHRPTVRSVLQGLLRKRLLPAEHCVAKVKRHFSSSGGAPSSGGTEDGVEQTAIKVSLKCPITFKRITLPARGQDCKHIQCFDLESYLQLNCERGAWRCPVCNKPALLEGLEVDQYIWGILTNLSNSDIEEVTIDATASWKPVSIKTVKEENDGVESCGAKRFKATSPGSMTMPTTSAWEMGQGLSSSSSSPYPATPTSLAPHSADMQTPANSSPGIPNGGYEFHSQASDFSPLSHLGESALDPLAAMEKSLSQHEQQMGLSNLHDSSAPAQRGTTVTSSATTPIQGPHTPHSMGGPPSVPPSEGGNSQPAPATRDAALATVPDLGDLHFDPAAVIEGEGQGQEGLNLLPESVVDPMELLSYLDPPEMSGSGASAAVTPGVASGATSSAGNDDLLSLFES